MIQTENKQHIKRITYQNIFRLYDVWYPVQSWQKVSSVLEKFLKMKTDL